MKYSTLTLLFVFCLLAFSLADPVDGKLKPKPKPKPKPKKHKHVPDSAYATQAATTAGTESVPRQQAHEEVVTSSSAATTVESTGLVAVLGGVAVACVVAIVAIIRKPEVQHEPLPDSSERAVDSVL